MNRRTNPETPIMQRVRLETAELGCRLFRNQVGHYQTPAGQHVTYGLGTGSSDLIGWTSFIIPPYMVGQRIAAFTAIEVKTSTGRATPEQIAYLKAVHEQGGLALLVRSPEEAVEFIRTNIPQPNPR